MDPNNPDNRAQITKVKEFLVKSIKNKRKWTSDGSDMVKYIASNGACLSYVLQVENG